MCIYYLITDYIKYTSPSLSLPPSLSLSLCPPLFSSLTLSLRFKGGRGTELRPAHLASPLSHKPLHLFTISPWRSRRSPELLSPDSHQVSLCCHGDRGTNNHRSVLLSGERSGKHSPWFLIGPEPDKEGIVGLSLADTTTTTTTTNNTHFKQKVEIFYFTFTVVWSLWLDNLADVPPSGLPYSCDMARNPL